MKKSHSTIDIEDEKVKEQILEQLNHGTLSMEKKEGIIKLEGSALQSKKKEKVEQLDEPINGLYSKLLRKINLEDSEEKFLSNLEEFKDNFKNNGKASHEEFIFF